MAYTLDLENDEAFGILVALRHLPNCEEGRWDVGQEGREAASRALRSVEEQIERQDEGEES